MVIAVRHRHARERVAAIRRAVHSDVENVNGVGFLGIGEDVGVIPGALAEFEAAVNLHPFLAAVVRTVESALRRFDQGVDTIAIGS